MRKFIALTLAAFACSSALALNAYLNDQRIDSGDAQRAGPALELVMSTSDRRVETDNSRECSLEEGILSDCIFI